MIIIRNVVDKTIGFCSLDATTTLGLGEDHFRGLSVICSYPNDRHYFEFVVLAAPSLCIDPTNSGSVRLLLLRVQLICLTAETQVFIEVFRMETSYLWSLEAHLCSRCYPGASMPTLIHRSVCLGRSF